MSFKTLSAGLLLASALVGLSSCAPTTAVKPAVYQATKQEVMQTVTSVASSFSTLPGYQSLEIWSKQTDNSKITLTSAVRIKAEALHESVVNANDDREIIFRFEEKGGLTYVTYSKTGYVDAQISAVFNALDKLLVRVNLP